MPTPCWLAALVCLLRVLGMPAGATAVDGRACAASTRGDASCSGSDAASADGDEHALLQHTPSKRQGLQNLQETEQGHSQPDSQREPFAVDEQTVEAEEHFDFIVVGAGLTGSAVASRLAEKAPRAKVLVLEGGKAEATFPPSSFIWDSATFERWPGPWRNDATSVPGDYNQANCWDPSRGECRNITWPPEYTTGAYQPRIRGGGGSVNGALHQIPRPNMFQGGYYFGWPAWPKNWQFSDMAPYYQEVMNTFNLTTTPSADGKHYLDASGANQLHEALTTPCNTCKWYPNGLRNASALSPTNGTLGIPFVIARNGSRQSTATVLLTPSERRQQLDVRLESEVTEILHTLGRATAVKYTCKGRKHVVHLREGGVVVMAAGAFNTPRLLLKSGITNRGMGRNLSDHALIMQTYEMSDAWMLLPFQQPTPDNASIAQHIAFHSGGLAQFGPTITAFLRAPGTPGTPEDYDVEIFVNPASSPNQLLLYFALMRPTCSSVSLKLQKNGTLTRSKPGLYFGCRRDIATMQFALDWVRDRFQTQTKNATCLVNCGLVQEVKVRPSIGSLNHWGGSCALGRCVSPTKLLVRGTSNVAVADASLIPGQIWGHPSMTLEAMALRAGDILARTWLSDLAEPG